METIATTHTHEPELAERMFEPALVRRLCSSLLRRGVPARAVDDDVQQARIEVWQRFAGGAHEVDEIERLLFHVAQRRAVDWWRSERRHVLRDDFEELLERAPGAPADATLREALAAIERDLTHDPQLAQALRDVADKEICGEEYDDIARRGGEPAGRVRKRVFKLRAYAQEHLGDYRGLVVLAILALVASLLRRSPQAPDMGKEQQPRPVPTIVAPPKPAPEVTPAERAREMRQQAKSACSRGRYRECLEGLDAARAIDEVGDDEAEVRALREMAVRGVREFTEDGKPRGR
jgi:DNA-directed RNA polymerase specialized sigma24 family protein